MSIMLKSSADISVHKLAMEVRSNIVIDVAFLFFDFLGLISENCILVPSLGEGIG